MLRCAVQSHGQRMRAEFELRKRDRKSEASGVRRPQALADDDGMLSDHGTPCRSDRWAQRRMRSIRDLSCVAGSPKSQLMARMKMRSAIPMRWCTSRVMQWYTSDADTVTLQQYVWHSASAAACVALCLCSSVWQSDSAAT